MTTTARTKPEPKFATTFSTVPSFNLSWGYRKPLPFSAPATAPSTSNNAAIGGQDDGGLVAVTEKPMHGSHAEANQPKPWNLRTRRPDTERGEGVEKEKRVKFSVSLLKKEIEEDFLAMTGVRPARKPRKRVKSVQKQLDVMSPGFWLTEISVDLYKVNEHPSDVRKR